MDLIHLNDVMIRGKVARELSRLKLKNMKLISMKVAV